MNALLSIKPEFAEKILSGEKKYEFRRTSFRDADKIDTVYLYASSPDQKVVGAFVIDTVIEDDPEQLWEEYGHKSGISNREQFMKYYEGTNTGYAFKIDAIQEFNTPYDPWSQVEDFAPPTSFYYMSGEFLEDLQQRLSPDFSPRQGAVVSQYSSD